MQTLFLMQGLPRQRQKSMTTQHSVKEVTNDCFSLEKNRWVHVWHIEKSIFLISIFLNKMLLSNFHFIRPFRKRELNLNNAAFQIILETHKTLKNYMVLFSRH